jgi:curved DNA-binding protein CbpA
MKKSDELFKVMGINRTSDKEAIKKAYKSRAKELHPDKGGNESDFKELNFAYSILINPEKLENFDSGINQKDHDSEK